MSLANGNAAANRLGRRRIALRELFGRAAPRYFNPAAANMLQPVGKNSRGTANYHPLYSGRWQIARPM